MSTHSGSFLERVIRAIARGRVPVDAQKKHCDRHADRQSPIRWLSLR